MSEPAILSSESPDADVLVYDKDVAYYRGNLEVSDEGEDFDLEDSYGNEIIYEYVD